MPFPAGHKQKTHARIVKTASRLFRRDGYADTGVDRLMQAAGLTRGGFYAHFRDKAALLAEALDRAFAESREALLGGELRELEGDAWLKRASETYLTAVHRKNPGVGCAIPALGSEVARAPTRVRKTFATNIETLISAFSQRLGADPQSRRRAIAALSSWTGAMVLARAVGDDALADEIIEAVRESMQPGSESG
jgi:TetR/AcrR family transcriptional repressor of nem operon